MKKYRWIIWLCVYLLIGLAVYFTGYIEAPTPSDQMFTAVYITLLWPIVIGAYILQ